MKQLQIVSAVIANLDDLLSAFESKFENAEETKDIMFYVKDKDYLIECELEDITQLYSGCLINVVVKKDQQNLKSNSSNDEKLLHSPEKQDKKSACSIKYDNILNFASESLSDASGPELRHQHGTNNDTCMDMEKGVATAEHKIETFRNTIPPGYYVRLLGVPFGSSVGDIQLFFSGLDFVNHPNSIFFVKNVLGHDTGWENKYSMIFATFVSDNLGMFFVAMISCLNWVFST